MLNRTISVFGRRLMTTETGNFFQMFPKTFPRDISNLDKGFTVDSKLLRKEYRKLQALNHPDLTNELNKGNIDGGSKVSSSLINKAYETLHDPLKRAQYIISLHSSIDLNNDEIGKKYQFQDKAMLLEMMDIHERLEEIMDQRELNEMKKENDSKINNLIKELSSAFNDNNWELATLKTVRLKYCYNIKDALKNWAPGEPVTLTH